MRAASLAVLGFLFGGCGGEPQEVASAVAEDDQKSELDERWLKLVADAESLGEETRPILNVPPGSVPAHVKRRLLLRAEFLWLEGLNRDQLLEYGVKRYGWPDRELPPGVDREVLIDWILEDERIYLWEDGLGDSVDGLGYTR